jgi:prostaglandin-E synthase 1
MAITNDPAFAVYALSAAFLSIHMIVLDSYSGAVRAKVKVTPNKEDARQTASVALEEPEAVARVMRVNTVPFLVLGLVLVLIGTTKTTAMAYFGTFVAARLGHTFAYLAGKQPWRSIFFTIGQLAILGIVYQVVRAGIAGL